VPVSSTKGHTGHALGSAGILEAIIATLALRHQFAPGSPHTGVIDPTFRCRYLLDAANLPLRRVLSNSFGFGGSNCSLVLGSVA
jgi:3-oxoacyl-[acyl-carrier-protein] synthase-1